MSWEKFIEDKIINYVTEEGHNYERACSNGAIFGLDGSKWATSEKFPVSADEVKAITKFFNDHQAISLMIAGKKYQVTCNNQDSNSVYLKVTGGGACVAKTNKAIVIGTYDTNQKTKIDKVEKTQNVGYCNSAVENLQQYLIGIGY